MVLVLDYAFAQEKKNATQEGSNPAVSLAPTAIIKDKRAKDKDGMKKEEKKKEEGRKLYST